MSKSMQIVGGKQINKYLPFEEWKFKYLSKLCIEYRFKQRKRWVIMFKFLIIYLFSHRFKLKNKLQIIILLKILFFRENPYGENCIHN